MSKKDVDIRFNRQENYVLIKMTGVVDFQNILNTFDKVVNHSEFQLGMGRIWELTDASLESLSEDDVWMSTNYSEGFPHGIKDVNVAMVSENKDNYELLNSYQELAAKVQTTILVFDSLDKALHWLGKKRGGIFV